MGKQRRVVAGQSVPLLAGAKWLFQRPRGRAVRGEGILIYDAGNRPALEQTALGEAGEQVFGDPAAMTKLEKDDRAWVFTVSLEERDGPFHAQWWVGPPPPAGAVDRSRRPGNRPRAKRLSLPTGRVHVEGNMFEFSFGPYASRDEGARIRVPPGLYDVSLHQAPDPDRDIGRRYFFLAFSPVPGTAKPAKPRPRLEPDPRSAREQEAKAQMKRFRTGAADALTGKPRQSTDLHYRRGWRHGEQERKMYDRGEADGLAGKPVRYRGQKAYKRGWREGNRRRLAGA